MRKTALILLLTFLMVPFSCGKKEVKPPSQDSKTAEEAFAVSESIREAFIKNDSDTLLKDSTESGFKDITSGRRSYESVELEFTPRWVDIEQTQVMVNIAWKSKWTVAGKQVEDRGMAIFVMEGKPLKLAKILRANPFVAPEQ
jgi:hypothetical protein